MTESARRWINLAVLAILLQLAAITYAGNLLQVNVLIGNAIFNVSQRTMETFPEPCERDRSCDG